MNQLKDAMKKAGLNPRDFPSDAKKDNQKPKRAGKRSTGEITLRALRLILFSEVIRHDRCHQISNVQKDDLFDALISVFGEVSDRLEEYESERDAKTFLEEKA